MGRERERERGGGRDGREGWVREEVDEIGAGGISGDGGGGLEKGKGGERNYKI